MDMDVASMALTSSQDQLMLNVSTAMMAKSLDTMQTAGDGMVKMMENSVNPNLGATIDIRL